MAQSSMTTAKQNISTRKGLCPPKPCQLKENNSADLLEPFGFERGVSEGLTTIGPMSRNVTESSMDWDCSSVNADGKDGDEEAFLAMNYDEKTLIAMNILSADSDEHPGAQANARLFRTGYDKAFLVEAIQVVENIQLMIRLNSEFGGRAATLDYEFDQDWKTELNEGLRPLMQRSSLVAEALDKIVPAQYRSVDGDIIYFKAEHVAKLLSGLQEAMDEAEPIVSF
eukprot:CAMPEP_0117514448 /NCGR_PEP_ID=MMETSP0784-20121206/30074_1 /TAXON_ID=39447 /ORGANISM="" /LENGTH=225 /DNA_ID=CAMNT_0005310243 /DNA_START=97 /DNA_END=774 /DNA_ORIENTATION=+